MADSDCSIVFVPHPTGNSAKQFIDRTGQRFGRLTVIGFAGLRNHKSKWYCLCECGKTTAVTSCGLKTKNTQSCGCLGDELRKSRIKHGHSRSGKITPEFYAYESAKSRCNRPKNNQYTNYGGRGIEFRFESFSEFFAHIGNRPDSSYSLDRINVNGHYEPGNVRWASKQTQSNNSRSNILVTVGDVTKTVSEWLGGSKSKDYRRFMHLTRTHKIDAPTAVASLLNNDDCQVCVPRRQVNKSQNP